MLRPEDVNLIIAHKNCPDGFGAAWSAWTMHGNNIEYFYASYKGEINPDDIPDVTGKNVLMVDFAYPDIDLMNELNKKANKMLLLDHHKSARDKLEGKIDCDHIFDMNRSGARMAWDYFFPGSIPPLLIQYIEDRDIWKWELPNAREFLACLDSYPQKFEIYEKISQMTTEEISHFISQGRAICRYHNTLVKRTAKSAVGGYLLTPDGEKHKCFIVNCPSKGIVSDVGHTLAHDDVIGFMWGYSHDENHYFGSLRSVGDKDVSAIAEQFGGGGHKNASGLSYNGDIRDIFVPYSGDMAEESWKKLEELIGD